MKAKAFTVLPLSRRGLAPGERLTLSTEEGGHVFTVCRVRHKSQPALTLGFWFAVRVGKARGWYEFDARELAEFPGVSAPLWRVFECLGQTKAGARLRACIEKMDAGGGVVDKQAARARWDGLKVTPEARAAWGRVARGMGAIKAGLTKHARDREAPF